MKRKCPLCFEDNLLLLFHSRDYRLRTTQRVFSINRCQSCSHRFTDISNFTIDETSYPKKFYDHHLSLNSSERSLVRILSSCNVNRVLDYGCGSGKLLRYLQNHGLTCFGYDPYSPDTDYHFLNQGNGSYDAVVCMHVLEHVEDPIGVLRFLHQRLNIGGVLIVEVPNVNSLSAKLFGKYWVHLDVPRHLHHFDYGGLEQLLSSVGFGSVRSVNLCKTSFPLTAYHSMNNRLDDINGGMPLRLSLTILGFCICIALNMIYLIYPRRNEVVTLVASK